MGSQRNRFKLALAVFGTKASLKRRKILDNGGYLGHALIIAHLNDVIKVERKRKKTKANVCINLRVKSMTWDLDVQYLGIFPCALAKLLDMCRGTLWQDT